MQVHDPLHLALRGVRRRDDQPEVQAAGHAQPRQHTQDAADPRGAHHSSRTNSNASGQITKKTTSNPHSSFTQWLASANPAPLNRASVAFTDPRITGTVSGKSSNGSITSRA